MTNYYADDGDEMKAFVVSMTIFGSGTIALGFMAGYPIVGIALAVFVVVSLYGVSVSSQLSGAETALRNPPSPGETQITLKIFDREIPISGKFVFSPPAHRGENNNFEIVIASKNKGGRPQGSLKGGNNINSPDVMEWHKEAKRIWSEESYPAFVKFCEEAGEDEATVRSRIEKYLT